MAVGVAAEVKSKLSIVDVIGESVQLRKAGTTYKGLCPFHGEKTPSFVVTPGRDSWKCFGCGLGGDVFSFVMQREGIGFPEALKRLAAKAGVELDERTTREDARKARLREVLENAIAFYHMVLTQHRTGQPALDYLRVRGFTDETIERFQLGWAPSGWDEMSRMVQARRGVAPQELAEVGLTTPRSSGRGAYDRFRSRIIFPIRDANGSAVGLGGRILPAAKADGANGDGAGATDRGPKYLNSPATPLFDKSRTLYLVDRAKSSMRKGGQAVIVEGYTDALMAHQAGFDNVVASLGTALTAGQIALVTRYAARIALAYDVDPAGQSAGSFGVSELTSLISEIQRTHGADGVQLTDVGVVRLPEGKDPDEVIRDTPDLWREAVRTKVEILHYLIDYHASRLNLREASGRQRLVDAVIPTLQRVVDPVVRDEALATLRQRSGVEERVLLEALYSRAGRRSQSQGGEHAGARITLDAVVAARESVSPDEMLRSISPVEAELLRLLLLAPDQQLRATDHLRAANLQLPSTPARELLAAVLADREADCAAGGPGRFERGRFLDALDPETRALAIAIYARRGPDPDALGDRVTYAVDQCLLQLEADALDDAMTYTRAEVADAEARHDEEALDRLLDQERTYHEARRSLDRRREQMSLLSRSAGGRS